MRIMIALLAAAAFATAQDEKRTDELEAVIVDITGTVDAKRPADKDWVAAEKNMKLAKGSELCTAEGSTATLLFQPNLTIVVKAVTLAKIDDLAKTAKGMKTDVKLKFGSVNIELKKGEIESSLKVATPNATTSVSGSTATMWGWAQGGGGWLNLKVEFGKWLQNNNFTGGGQTFGPGEGGNDLDKLWNDFLDKYYAGQYQDFFGRDEGETGNFDPTGGMNPLFEGGSMNLNPFGDAFALPSALPGPPGTP